MKEPPPNPKETPEDQLSAIHATRMLQLGLNEPARPIDHLLDRLSLADATDWLDSALLASPVATFGPPVRLLIEGTATLGHLQLMKQRSKQLLAERHDTPSRLRAMIGYFFPIAAALANHQVVITGHPREELLLVLEDLAAVTPPPWSTMFHQAASALTDAPTEPPVE